MSTHYKNAPITEALIDVRVELRAEFEFEQLHAIKSLVANEYPREELVTMATARISFGPEVHSSTQHKKIGLKLWSVGDKQVFQARLDGFTFSRLEPYETWERLRDEARRLWDIYRESVKPTRITRIAVRYINQLILPGERAEPEDYFKTYPYLTPDLPRELRDFGPFVMSLQLPQPDLKGTLVINEASAQPKRPDTLSIILDIDLFVEQPEIDDEESLWGLFQRLRERKNLYFEACITDRTRELIS
jgi:uncharacterized protein (TIGR04255 family)